MSDGDLQRLPDDTGGLLGRHVSHDVRNRAFPARGVLFSKAEPLRSRTWDTYAKTWDQGQTSSCTIQAAARLLYSDPFISRVDVAALRSLNLMPKRIAAYKRSKRFDPFPGVNYAGTSTDAPFRMMRADGRIKAWRWCFGVTETLQTLCHHGPVAIGVSWYDAMFRPDSSGHIAPGGSVRGGHAVALVGLDVDERFVVGVNSWGPWGPLGGRFRLGFDDLDRLLSEQGEAVTVAAS